MRWFGVVALSACGRVGFDATATPPADAEPPGDLALATPCLDLPGILFCEGFEDGTQLGIEEANPPSFVMIDALQVYRGRTAQHARTTRPTEQAWQLGSVLPDVTSGELHLRWYHYLPSSNPYRTIATIHVVADLAPNRGVVFGLTDGAADVTATANGETDISNVQLPVDRWACVQMSFTISTTAGVVETSIDGTRAARLTNVNTSPAGGYQNIHAGMFSAAVDTVLDLWTDELAVGTLPIPCD